MDAFLLWWKRKFCDHIWKIEKQEKLGYNNIITKFPVAGHPGKKFVTTQNVFAEQQKCVVCDKRRVVENEYQVESKLMDA